MSPEARFVLRASRNAVEKHWGLLLEHLHRILPAVGIKYWIEPSALRGISGDLLCSRYIGEKVTRELGVDVPVVPLIASRHDGIKYWLSLHQSWGEPTDPRARNFVYHTTGITVFFGSEGNKDKVQLFRAEWPGTRIRAGGEVEFEAPGAGHPHWQFDAYQHHIREAKNAQQRLDDLGNLLSEEFPGAEDFGDTVFEMRSAEEEAEWIAHMQRLTKIHFASSTRWAEDPWRGDETNTQPHAKTPADTSQILNWATSTLVYVQREISR